MINSINRENQLLREQTKLRLKVSFKNIDQAFSDRSKSATCLLLISVGQEAHEKEHFESTIQLIRSSFKKCIILLGDSIQRYTIALTTNKLPEQCLQAATHEGDHWLQRNSSTLSMLPSSCHVIRWNYWLSHPDFIKTKQCLETALKEDDLYYQAFAETVNTFLNRYKKQNPSLEYFDQQRSELICLNYLLEECAIFCLWPELECEFEIYPNAHNLAIEATRKKFLVPSFPNLLHSVSLRFRHSNLLKPLQFECSP